MNLKQGLFITLEGVDGSGKTTAMSELREIIAAHGLKAHFTFEPGNTQVGAELRKLLLSPHRKIMTPMTELLLFFADRAEHLQQVVIPHLREGYVVVCDRFTDSTFAYQGEGRNLGADKVRLLEQLVQGDLRPDLVLLLDVAPDQAHRAAGSDRIENEDADFHRRVRQCYLHRAEADARRYRVIDASRSIEEVVTQLKTAIDALLDGA